MGVKKIAREVHEGNLNNFEAYFPQSLGKRASNADSV